MTRLRAARPEKLKTAKAAKTLKCEGSQRLNYPSKAQEGVKNAAA
jgi:hypothetical protein